MKDIITINDDSFEKVTSSGSVVVDFYADWCGPCKMMAPIFSEANGDYGDKVIFAKLNIDDNRDTAMANKVMSIPTLIFFKDGAVVDRVSGVIDKATLYAKLDTII